MSQHAAASACSPWDLAGSQSRTDRRGPEDHHRDVLNKAYDKALAALASAQDVVAVVASGLYDVESSQTDVPARLAGRSSTRFTGKKRKYSPSIYDYSDSCFAGTHGKADTPTQELLPASRSELRNHQLQAVRWLASLEAQGAGGVLADELELDRRAEVAGLLSHMMLNTTPAPPSAESPYHHNHQHHGAQGHGGCGATGAGGGSGHVCVLLAPGCCLGEWADAISEHVDVCVHVYDGTADSAAALQVACAGSAAQGAHLAGLAPLAQPPPPPLSAGRRSTVGGTNPHPNPLHPRSQPAPLGTSSTDSSAAGVFPPIGNQHQHQHHPGGSAAVSPLLRQAVGAPGGGAAAAAVQHKSSMIVVLAPLEHLHRDAALLSQVPQRLLVVDLAPPATGGGSAVRFSSGGGSSGCDSGGACRDGSEQPFAPFGVGFGSGPGSGSQPGSGSGSGPASGGGGGALLPPAPSRGRRHGMELEGHHHLQLLNRMPAASRVLLSAGVPEPAGDGIWLLLQLLAPRVHRPLWEAVCELQGALVGSGAVGAACKGTVLSEVHGRLWALLRPLTLHRRARDVDLGTMRAAATNLNLYDHFSAARADDV